MSTTRHEPNQNVKYLGNIIINHHPDTKNNVAIRADQKSIQRSSNLHIRDNFISGAKIAIAVNPKYKNVSVANCALVNVGRKVFFHGKQQHCENKADVHHKYINGQKTNQPLWPWPNQDLIKADMCKKGERQSDWCKTTKNLTDYVLSHLPKSNQTSGQMTAQ